MDFLILKYIYIYIYIYIYTLSLSLTHTQIYIYIYIYVCVCVCMCVVWVLCFAIFWQRVAKFGSSGCLCGGWEGDKPYWWDAEFAGYSPSITCRICLQGTAFESMVLGLPNYVWLSRLLQSEQNFSNHLAHLAQKMFLDASTALWPRSNSQCISFQIRLHYTFTSTAFKSHKERSNAQRVSARNNHNTPNRSKYRSRDILVANKSIAELLTHLAYI